MLLEARKLWRMYRAVQPSTRNVAEERENIVQVRDVSHEYKQPGVGIKIFKAGILAVAELKRSDESAVKIIVFKQWEGEEGGENSGGRVDCGTGNKSDVFLAISHHALVISKSSPQK